MILLWLWVACRKPAPPPPLQVVEQPTEELAPAGVVADGVFVDDRWPLVVPVPEGWSAEPGRADTPLRIRAAHADTGAVVEILALPIGATEPLSRAGCSWDFLDTGRYRGLAVTDEVTVATCVPDRPEDSHVFAVLLARPEVVWSLEIAPEPDRMIAGKAAGEALLRGVRFERPAAIPVFEGL